MPPLNFTQQKLLATIGIVSGTISLLGSSILIRMVLMTQGQNVTYNRLLIGLSVMDIFHNISWSLQPFLVPRSNERVWSFGNDRTCSAAGFFVQLGVSVFLYNGALATYFLITIVFGVSEKKVVQYAEPWLHVVPLGYPLITATVGAGIDLYSSLQLGSLCWIGQYPKGCEDDSETVCISTTIGWIYSGLPAMGTFVFLVVANTLIYSKVRTTTGRTLRFARNGRCHRADREVAAQSTLYVMACILTLIWPAILRTLESIGVQREDESDVLVLLLLGQLFYPFQGFWNCLIYVRPRYLRWRRRAPEQSRWWCFQQALHLEAYVHGTKIGGTTVPEGVPSSGEGQRDDGEEDAEKSVSS